MTLPRVARAGDAFTATISDDWLQGRTAYGGASAAIALAAVKAAYDDLPPLRSLQIAFAGPLAGEVSATPQLIRRGKNSAFVACDMGGADGTGLRALFLFMNPRTSTIAHSGPTPPLHIRPGQLANGALPGFLANFDFAEAGKRSAGHLRWARLKAHDDLDSEIELVAVADALPPAAMALADRWGPISTTLWQLNLLTDSPRTTDGWWLIGADLLQAGNGASSQSMTIWNHAGMPIATATQSVALFI